MEAAGGQWEEDMELRKGPWTIEEDLLLVNYISNHGEGRWNSLAHSAGLRRTGKSCRLRWLNYLRPDLRRGNITPEEQLLILELHSRWGNRWSKIAQHLPGRTDNEIKNYWRTRVQKQAKQLKCDVNSKQFKDAMKYLWMPRLVERIRAAADVKGGAASLPPEEDLSTETECSSVAAGGDKSEDFGSEEMMMVGGDGFFPETLTSPISSVFDGGFMGLEQISLVAAGEEDYFQSESLWNSDDFWFFQ